MILYKYVSYDAGLQILRNNSIGFSEPRNFNDPFETKAESYDPTLVSGSTSRKAAQGIMASAIQLVAQETGILSLTRAPLNSLMWAHYGLRHTGMVIGIDAGIREFVSEDMNLLPIQFGSVIYTNERPRAPLLTRSALALGDTFYFQMDCLEHLQRIFLFKPMCWSYEEEVRVVKCLRGSKDSSDIKSGTFSVISVVGWPLYLLHLPRGAIREVFLGARSEPLVQSRVADFIKSISPFQPNISVFACRISESSWNLEKYRVEES